MADKRIDQLTAATTMGDDDLLVLQQNNQAKKLSGATLSDYIYDVVEVSNTQPVESRNKVWIKPSSEDLVLAEQSDVDELTAIFDNALITDLKPLTTLSHQYIDSSKRLFTSSNWNSYTFDATNINKLTEVSCYSNNASYYQIAFYSSETPANASFISGITFGEADVKVTRKNIAIPENAKSIMVLNRVTTGTDYVINGIEDTALKDKFDFILTDGSIMNTDHIVPYGFATSNGRDSPTTTTHWNTGLIWIGEGKTILKSNYSIYKTGFYNYGGKYLGADTDAHANITIPNGTYFIKAQFTNTVVSFANADTVKLYVSNSTSLINTNNLLSNSISEKNLTEDLYNVIAKARGFGTLPYSGNKIQLNHTFDYASISSISGDNQQAGCIYGDYLFRFTSVGTYKVLKYNPLQLIASGTFPNDLIPHCNTAYFSTEFYDESDAFPIVYVNAYNNTGLPKGTCYGFRVNSDYTLTLVQTITIGFTTSSTWTDGSSDTRPYGNFCADTDSGFLYVYTLLDTTNVTRFFKFNLPKLSDGDVTLAESDIIERWDCNYFQYIQDNFCNNGNIYLISGYGSVGSNGYLRVVNTVTKKEETTINLNKTMFASLGYTFEPECLAEHNGTVYFGGNTIYALKF